MGAKEKAYQSNGIIPVFKDRVIIRLKKIGRFQPSRVKSFLIIDSVETGMNGSSLQNNENYLRGKPGSGPLFRHGSARKFQYISVIDPPRGRPSGGGGVYRTLEYEVPHHHNP
jgi:hypothetical protein